MEIATRDLPVSSCLEQLFLLLSRFILLQVGVLNGWSHRENVATFPECSTTLDLTNTFYQLVSQLITQLTQERPHDLRLVPKWTWAFKLLGVEANGLSDTLQQLETNIDHQTQWNEPPHANKEDFRLFQQHIFIFLWTCRPDHTCHQLHSCLYVNLSTWLRLLCSPLHSSWLEEVQPVHTVFVHVLFPCCPPISRTQNIYWNLSRNQWLVKVSSIPAKFILLFNTQWQRNLVNVKSSTYPTLSLETSSLGPWIYFYSFLRSMALLHHKYCCARQVIDEEMFQQISPPLPVIHKFDWLVNT